MQMPIVRTRARWNRKGGMVAVWLAGLAASAAAHQTATPAPVGVVPHQHPTGHVGDHGDQSWPPQPRGLRNPIDRSDARGREPARQAVQRRFDALEQNAVRPDLREALGGSFTRIAVVDDDDKSGTTRVARFVYFSRSTNSTVEVHVDGTGIRRVTSLPAAAYQPEITDDEIAEAADIGRRYWLGQGRTRVQALQGYGILAYRPEGKGFYDGRVVYVSFHAGDDAPPEFAAWVDLTRQTVIKSREERR